MGQICPFHEAGRGVLSFSDTLQTAGKESATEGLPVQQSWFVRMHVGNAYSDGVKVIQKNFGKGVLRVWEEENGISPEVEGSVYLAEPTRRRNVLAVSGKGWPQWIIF